jgi:O-antigen/teichoic acid export membrane protein
VYVAAKYYLDEAYLKNYQLFIICITGVSLYSFSMPDHYTIYGLGRDKVILLINSSASVVFIASLFALKEKFGIHSLAIALFFGLSHIALGRRIAASYLLKTILFSTHKSL